MAPPRGRRKKATASPRKAAISTREGIDGGELTSETASNINSINPKEQVDDQSTFEEVEKVASNMEVDESVLQSSENCGTAQPTTDPDSQLLYEGDDINNEVSYAPEDVDALLGDDDNEVLDNAVDDFVAGDETPYDNSTDAENFNDGTDLQEEEDDKTDMKDAKAKAKLVKTTYHYVTDKTEDKHDNRNDEEGDRTSYSRKY